MTDGPLIVQSDKTVLLEVDHEQAGAARAAIAPFAELERAPEHVHTYRITPLALWNARAAGHDAEQVVDALVTFSRYAVPQPLLVDIVDTMARYGRLQLVKHPTHGLSLISLDRAVLAEVRAKRAVRAGLPVRELSVGELAERHVEAMEAEHGRKAWQDPEAWRDAPARARRGRSWS